MTAPLSSWLFSWLCGFFVMCGFLVMCGFFDLCGFFGLCGKAGWWDDALPGSNSRPQLKVESYVNLR